MKISNESCVFGFAVLTAVTKKRTVFWDVTLCSLALCPEDGAHKCHFAPQGALQVC
jgi:hypothetical protein